VARTSEVHQQRAERAVVLNHHRYEIAPVLSDDLQRDLGCLIVGLDDVPDDLLPLDLGHTYEARNALEFNGRHLGNRGRRLALGALKRFQAHSTLELLEAMPAQ